MIGLGLFGLLALAIALLIWRWPPYQQAPETKESFLVRDRDIPFLTGVSTITAAWTQPLALLASGVFLYRSEWHFLAFAVPNIFAIGLATFLIPRIRRLKPDGYTGPQFIEQAFGGAVRSVYAFITFITLIYLMALNMTMLQQWLTQYLGISTFVLPFVIGAAALLWTAPRGLRGAVMGDNLKSMFVFGGVLAILLLALHAAGDLGAYVRGAPIAAMLWTPAQVFWIFGVPFSISLIAAAISNPEMVERAYALKSSVASSRTILVSVVLFFATILIAYGSLGLFARELGIPVNVDAKEYPALELLTTLFPAEIALLVTVALSLIIVATISNALAGAGDIGSIELYQRFVNPAATDEKVIRWGRISMIFFVIAGGAIAALNIDVAVLLQNMAIVRGELIIPILLALFAPAIVPRAYVFWGIVGGAVSGIIVTFGMANTPLGALLAFAVPLAACAVGILVRSIGTLYRGRGGAWYPR